MDESTGEAKGTVGEALNELFESVAFGHVVRGQSDQAILHRRRNIFVVDVNRVDHAVDAAVEALIEVDFEVFVQVCVRSAYS